MSFNLFLKNTPSLDLVERELESFFAERRRNKESNSNSNSNSKSGRIRMEDVQKHLKKLGVPYDLGVGGRVFRFTTCAAMKRTLSVYERLRASDPPQCTPLLAGGRVGSVYFLRFSENMPHSRLAPLRSVREHAVMASKLKQSLKNVVARTRPLIFERNGEFFAATRGFAAKNEDNLRGRGPVTRQKT